MPRFCRWQVLACKRKVRAAEGIPLLKLEAIGDDRCRQKKITAFGGFAVVEGKGEKVV